jgi:hypothetical protein
VAWEEAADRVWQLMAETDDLVRPLSRPQDQVSAFGAGHTVAACSPWTAERGGPSARRAARLDRHGPRERAYQMQECALLTKLGR